MDYTEVLMSKLAREWDRVINSPRDAKPHPNGDVEETDFVREYTVLEEILRDRKIEEAYNEVIAYEYQLLVGLEPTLVFVAWKDHETDARLINISVVVRPVIVDPNMVPII